MCNSHAMKVRHTVQDHPDNIPSLFLLEMSSRVDLIKEVTSGSQFKDHVHFVVRLEDFVKGNDIWVPHSSQDT